MRRLQEMKRNKLNFLISLLLLTLLLFFSIYFVSVRSSFPAIEQDNRNSLTILNGTGTEKVPKFNFIPHAPIFIKNDGNFSDYGLPGLGTPEDPYRIENYYITSTEFNGIHIADTTSYFKIQNCFIEVGDNRGIRIKNVGINRTIIDNNTINANYGIVILSSSESNITDNYCIGSETGVRIYNSDFSYIATNTFSGFSGLAGIQIDESDNCLIEKNICEDNFHGILVSISSSNTILNNTCRNSTATEINIYMSPSTTITDNICKNSIKHGLWLFYSVSSIVENNLLYNSDLKIDDDLIGYSSLIVQNNMVNGKKIGFFMDEKDIELNTPEYGKLILVNCTNMNISNQNFSGLSFEGISVFSCNGLLIENNFLDDIGYFGVWAFETPDLKIINNHFSTGHTYSRAIRLDTCDQALIMYNNFTDNSVAISIDESDSNLISTNVFENSTDSSISVRSSNSTIIYNNICDNQYLDDLEGVGIYLYDSNFTQIEQNICYDFYEYGIQLRDSCFAEITDNLIQNNFQYGIHINTNSINNSIHHNTFHNNNPSGVSQAYDDGFNNTWFDSISLEGNYWSDYSGTGIYSIEGSAGSTDSYPLNDPSIPIIPEFIVQKTIRFNLLLIPFLCFMVISFRRKKSM